MQFRDLNRQYQKLKSEIDNGIQSVINSTSFISGPQVKELENELASYVGVKHCITCANGTDAITLALMTLEIGDGDIVFVPDFTFFSSGECPAYEGAIPMFVDVDKTFNIDPGKLEKAIENVILEGKYVPKAVISVDLFGQPADYEEIIPICKKYGLYLIEDSAQGFGGTIKGKKACSFGDISTTSFFPAKPLGCYGDGGAIFTDNDEWASYIRSICVHGKDIKNPDDPNSKYNNIRIGMNSRLDTLQAAILLPKLKAFKENELDYVNSIATWYNEELCNTDIIIPFVRERAISSWAQYTIRLPEYVSREELQTYLKRNGIPTMIYYMKPMHTQDAFRGSYSSFADCPNTELFCKCVLSLPMHPYMTKEEVCFITQKIKEYISENKKG